MNRITEHLNPISVGIDDKKTREILEIINNEDETIAQSIRRELLNIEKAVELIISTLKSNGKVYLLGAGTSGRLCVLEAAEIPPTFGISPDSFKAIIAGGKEAIFQSVEDVEDDYSNARIFFQKNSLRQSDLIIGVTASGSTPFILGVLSKAKEMGIKTIGLTCNEDTPLSKLSDLVIEVITGPEVVAGSTRMKAGTSQKMVLNMITTTAMIKLGLVYDGYMVGVQPTNKKLRDRSKKMVTAITGTSIEESEIALKKAGWDVRVALIIIKKGLTKEQAVKLLKNYTLRDVLSMS